MLEKEVIQPPGSIEYHVELLPLVFYPSSRINRRNFELDALPCLPFANDHPRFKQVRNGGREILGTNILHEERDMC